MALEFQGTGFLLLFVRQGIKLFQHLAGIGHSIHRQLDRGLTLGQSLSPNQPRSTAVTV